MKMKKIKKIAAIIKNFFFLHKYPFWKEYNVFSGKFCGYDCSWYDCLPDGWRKAFGKELSDELLKAGKEVRKKNHKYIRWKSLINITDVKEKYGTLRIYASCRDDVFFDIISKYEDKSAEVCINCGEKASYMTNGYIDYLCDDCFEKELLRRDIPDERKEELRENCRISLDNQTQSDEKCK